MICALLRDLARESRHGPAVISFPLHLPQLPSGKQPISPRTIACSTGHTMPSKTFRFLSPFVFLFHLKQRKIEWYPKICAVIKKHQHTIPVIVLSVSVEGSW